MKFLTTPRFLTALSFLFITITSNTLKQSHASTSTPLEQKISNMIAGDRSNVCMAVATIGESIESTIVCAAPNELKLRGLTADTAFEIGSLSKLMTGNVLAGLIRDSELSLETDLAALLPESAKVPSFNGQAIKLKHIVTHSSGLPPLPSRMPMTNLDNPYKGLSKKALLDSLQDVKLAAVPGENFEYSNYAMMLLSFGLSHYTGKDFDTLLSNYVFSPIGMQQAFSQRRPKGVDEARGHSQLGATVPHWHFAKNIQGVGGVRASLNDMIRYAQANLSLLKTPANNLLQESQQEVLSVGGQSVGMNWLAAEIGGARLLMHEGGTGGFSSAIVLDTEQQRGVVILADTALTNVGGVGRHALALMDLGLPQPKARQTVDAPKDLLEALTGEYRLADSGLDMKLWVKDGTLRAQATGQGAFSLQYDSEGDFYPSAFDALLRPTKTATGQAFEWHQGGGVMPATKLDNKRAAYKVDPTKLNDYSGTYPLMPGFNLTVTSKLDQLFIQGTGQPALPVTPVEEDEFSFDKAGAYFIFNRADDGRVISIVLKQRGQTLTGDKQ